MEEKQQIEEKEAPPAPSAPPPPYPPSYYPPPPPPSFEEVLSPEERGKLSVLKAISYITVTICVISLIAFIAGIIFFNMAAVTSPSAFRDVDALRGIVLMFFSAFLLFTTYVFIIMGMKRLEIGGG